jgi:hypothetical protein
MSRKISIFFREVVGWAKAAGMVASNRHARPVGHGTEFIPDTLWRF